jgi:hypothetical protein
MNSAVAQCRSHIQIDFARPVMVTVHNILVAVPKPALLAEAASFRAENRHHLASWHLAPGVF